MTSLSATTTLINGTPHWTFDDKFPDCSLLLQIYGVGNTSLTALFSHKRSSSSATTHHRPTHTHTSTHHKGSDVCYFVNSFSMALRVKVPALPPMQREVEKVQPHSLSCVWGQAKVQENEFRRLAFADAHFKMGCRAKSSESGEKITSLESVHNMFDEAGQTAAASIEMQYITTLKEQQSKFGWSDRLRKPVRMSNTCGRRRRKFCRRRRATKTMWSSSRRDWRSSTSTWPLLVSFPMPGEKKPPAQQFIRIERVSQHLSQEEGIEAAICDLLAAASAASQGLADKLANLLLAALSAHTVFAQPMDTGGCDVSGTRGTQVLGRCSTRVFERSHLPFRARGAGANSRDGAPSEVVLCKRLTANERCVLQEHHLLSERCRAAQMVGSTFSLPDCLPKKEDASSWTAGVAILFKDDLRKGEAGLQDPCMQKEDDMILARHLPSAQKYKQTNVFFEAAVTN